MNNTSPNKPNQSNSGGPNQSNSGGSNSSNVWKVVRRYLPWIIFAAILVVIIYFLFFYSQGKYINFQQLLAILNKDKTAHKGVFMQIDVNQGVLAIHGAYWNGSALVKFTSSAYGENAYNELFTAVNNNPAFGDGNVKTNIAGQSFWTILLQLLPIIAIITIFVLFYLNMQKQSGGQFMKNTTTPATSNVKFDNVAGYLEEKQEIQEILEYLKNPRRFAAMGIRIPKGVIFSGPPGTGKTFFAKSLAGEASVPFYNVSASEFVELFVGLGAKKIRDLFKKARKTSPCIIFIDEIDAVGRQRGAGLGGGNDEREQTLNQLLVELDGFNGTEGVIVLASTNRIDVLDPALLRPGRFDRHVNFHLPNLDERRQILKIHSYKKNVDPSVSWLAIARRTPGFSGAQLENILNEAAILALRHKRTVITVQDIDDAIDRVLGGPAKYTKKYTEAEKRTIAYHESGHALIGIKLAHADIVQKITIIPRGNAGGYTMMTPKEETYLMSKAELLSKITGYLGGRASEEIINGADNITTGAHDDISKATTIARKMVTELGMSKLGIIKLEENDADPFLGRKLGTSNGSFSNELSHQVDIEIKRIIDECYEKAKEIISANRHLLDILAKTLIEIEVLTAEQIEYIVKHEDFPKEYNVQQQKDRAEETRISKIQEKEHFAPKKVQPSISSEPIQGHVSKVPQKSIKKIPSSKKTASTQTKPTSVSKKTKPIDSKKGFSNLKGFLHKKPKTDLKQTNLKSSDKNNKSNPSNKAE